jgi:hypothetical protein
MLQDGAGKVGFGDAWSHLPIASARPARPRGHLRGRQRRGLHSEALHLRRLDHGVGGRQALALHGLVVVGAGVGLCIAVLPTEQMPAAAREA